MLTTIEKEIILDIIKNPGDSFYENVLSDFLDEQGVDHYFRKSLDNNNLVAELKPYQEKYLDIWAKYWIDIGFCTKPTDEVKAENYFYNFYKQLGFSKPKKIVWFDNPIEMCDRIDLNNQPNSQMWHQIWRQIWNPLQNQTWNRINDKVWNKINNQISNQVSGKIRSKVLSQIWNQIRNQAWNYILYGQHDAHWIAHYSYCAQVLRIEFPKKTVPLMLLAQEVNWWIPAEQTVYVVRKPKECVLENGKFVKLVYQDGYTII
jgi:hypothetical protein